MEMNNWDDKYRGVVHLGSPYGGFEYTLCGFAYDEPVSEHGGEAMSETDAACTCEECKRIALVIFPFLNKEIRRFDKRKKRK